MSDLTRTLQKVSSQNGAGSADTSSEQFPALVSDPRSVLPVGLKVEVPQPPQHARWLSRPLYVGRPPNLWCCQRGRGGVGVLTRCPLTPAGPISLSIRRRSNHTLGSDSSAHPIHGFAKVQVRPAPVRVLPVCTHPGGAVKISEAKTGPATLDCLPGNGRTP